MTKRKSPLKLLGGIGRGKRYPSVDRKIVDWAEHIFEEDMLYIRVRFTDSTDCHPTTLQRLLCPGVEDAGARCRMPCSILSSEAFIVMIE
jgi:hypothetical protein